MSENTFGSGQANENALPDPSTLSYEQARDELVETVKILCLLYTSPSPRDKRHSRMPSSA